MQSLLQKSCTALPDGSPALDAATTTTLLETLGEHWGLDAAGHLSREFIFPAFETGLDFVNQVGGLAQAEDHHPELQLDRRKVRITLWTHSVGGLSENDFILAAKITDTITSLATARMVDVAAIKGEAPSTEPPKRLDSEALREAVEKLPGWLISEGGRLTRSFETPNFVEALSLTNRVATLAKERKHHPLMSLSSQQVTMGLWTFPVDGVSALDLEMAAAIDAIAAEN